LIDNQLEWRSTSVGETRPKLGYNNEVLSSLQYVLSSTLLLYIVYICAALQCIIFLMERNCDIFATDSAGLLPLHHAATNNHVDCVRFLVAQGTSLVATDNSGRTPLHRVNIYVTFYLNRGVKVFIYFLFTLSCKKCKV